MAFSDSTTRTGNIMRSIIVFALAPLLAGVITHSCFAQDEGKAAPAGAPPAAASANDGALEDKPDEKLQKTWPQVRQILQSGKFASDAEKTVFDNYFENYEFKNWTLKKNFSKIVGMRNQLKTNFRQAKTGQVHDRLNELTLDVLGKKLKNKKYSPVFLVNAMLAIGDLNANEGGPGASVVPLPAALIVLLDTLKDDQQLDAVKVAALAGIKHQVVYGVKEPGITTALLKLATSTESDVGKVWMRTQSIEILGLMALPGPNNQVVNLLISILEDKKATLTLRCAAAEALGKIPLASAAGLNAAKLIADLRQLMLDGCEAELKSAKDNDVRVSPRLMKTYYDAVTTALGDSSKGINSMQGVAAAKPQITELQAILKELFTVLDNSEATDEEIKDATETAKKKLKEKKAS
jgi:hypothetical protein